MPVSGGTTTHGIPKFADIDVPDLAAGGLGTILDSLDALLGGVKIAATVLGAPAATIDFSAIPATYSSLKLLVQGRTTDANVIAAIGIRLNGDAGANYDYEAVGAQAGAALFLNVLADSRLGNLALPAATATALYAGAIVCEIPNAGDTVFYKSAVIHNDAISQAGFQTSLRYGGVWRNVAKVNRITVTDTSGGNFVAGSWAALIGCP